ncbi:MAG: FmdB family zinc ribbon protein [Planctomycetota bacterium]|jgi:putative FmdB family regulatory protein
MPIYEYNCKECLHEFELLVSNPSKKVKCPACNSSKVEKQFSLFGMSGGDKKSTSHAGSDCTSCSSTSCKHCS